MAANQFRNVVFIDAAGTYNAFIPAGVEARIAAVLIDCGAAAGTLQLYSGSTVVSAHQVVGLHCPANDSRQVIMGFTADSGVLHSDNGFTVVTTGANTLGFIYLN